ncbi:MAG: ATP-dependent DNA helicase RecG [Thermomicrobium sp.]|nr:ATP-dependent DNA helicase RecG [Thermomicrobium sp.]
MTTGTDRDPREILARVFELEQRKGLQDTAVVGGLERFLARNLPVWAAREPALRARLERLASILHGYAGRPPHERAELLRRALLVLDGEPAERASRVAPSVPPAPQRARPARRPSAPEVDPDDPVTVLPGVGSQRARQLEALGVATVRELLYLVPRRYADYSQVVPIGRLGRLVRPGEEITCTVIGEVARLETREAQSGRRYVAVELRDETGSIPVVWFNPYVARQLEVGQRIAVSGKLEGSGPYVRFRNPEWEPADAELVHTGRIVPIYPLTHGLYQRQLRQLTRAALDRALPRLVDPLPPELRARYGLPALGWALERVHYPASLDEAERARLRLAFDEFLILQLGLVQRRLAWHAQPGTAIPIDRAFLERFLATLPFRLTGAQQRALEEILADLAQPHPMSRLLQGDVGSGKTVVAAAAALLVHRAGSQAAILAPTELLAEQHFRTLTKLYSGLGPVERPLVALLTGSTPERDRGPILAGLASGSIAIVVGTHALLEERVQFRDLALAVIDEQHRFGVLQRHTLRSKGNNPHVLVMTATPIPRSLALVLHGDLDLSIIDELPPGRQPVKTFVVPGRKRAQAYAFVRREIEQGHQAFVICPLVEESDAIEARAATAEYERLSRDVFPDLRLGLLHGRMSSREKDEVMSRFRDGEIDILVSTAVVEVGIDVPNATVILIEGAERFGLAQLHQFRGRVGRGTAPSYCLLVSDADSEAARQRLEAVATTPDGFRLAEIDLQLRGPGEFLGTRQSGLPNLRFASLADMPTLQAARRAAEELLARDPELAAPEHAALAELVRGLWARSVADVS